VQHQSHPCVAVGEHQQRQEVLQEDGEDADRLLRRLVRPLRVHRAVTLGLADMSSDEMGWMGWDGMGWVQSPSSVILADGVM